MTGSQCDVGRTYLGFDFGTRKIGIAVGQDLTRTARELDTIGAKDTIPDWDRIDAHITTWQPAALVVGVAVDSQGKETEMSAHARKFGQRLSGRYNLPVYWVNEYLTSESARQELSTHSGKTRGKKDQIAARLILETFMNNDA